MASSKVIGLSHEVAVSALHESVHVPHFVAGVEYPCFRVTTIWNKRVRHDH